MSDFGSHMVNRALWYNIFERNCPGCKKVVSWSIRKGLIRQTNIKCPSCKSTLEIHPRDRFINMGFLWLLASSFSAVFFKESYPINELIVIFLLIALNIPNYLNVFFSLHKTTLTSITKKKSRREKIR